MKNRNGAEVADIVFSFVWQAFLSFYHVDTTPDNWFLKTVAQAFDSLSVEVAVKNRMNTDRWRSFFDEWMA